MREIDITTDGGRRLHAYDTETSGRVPVFWLHGTPNLGEPPEPLFDVAADLGLRWLAYDRPGYGATYCADPGLLERVLANLLTGDRRPR